MPKTKKSQSLTFKKQPKFVSLGYLEVAVMPNGELIHLGKTVGWFKTSKDMLIDTEALRERLNEGGAE